MKCCRQLILFYILVNLSKGLCEDLLELDCDVNSDCNHVKGPEYNTTCLDGHCICNNLNGQRTPCRPRDNKLNNLIGGTCPCPQENAECNRDQSICYCQKGFVPSFDRRRCIKKSLALGELCEDNSQCLGLNRFAECHIELKKCMCQKNFIEHSGICISVVGLLEGCLDDQQCHNQTANTMCYNSTCTCTEGFTASTDRKCLPFADYKKSCKEDNQCKHKLGAGSECYMGLCSCDYKHFSNEIQEATGEKRFICERRIVRADYCRDHNDCYQFHLKSNEQSMECYFGECNCRLGFVNANEECIRSGLPWAGANFSIMTGLSLLLPPPLSLLSSSSYSASWLLSLQPYTLVTVCLNYPSSFLRLVARLVHQSLIPGEQPSFRKLIKIGARRKPIRGDHKNRQTPIKTTICCK